MNYNTVAHKIAYAQREAKTNAVRMALRGGILKTLEFKEVISMIPPAMRKTINVSIGSHSNEVYIGLTMRDLTSFKTDKKLLKVLEAFSGSEWTAATSDWGSDAPNRDYRFTKKVAWNVRSAYLEKLAAKHGGQDNNGNPDTFDITFNVYAYVRSDSPTCRIVIKGVREEIVRTNITEIICD